MSYIAYPSRREFLARSAVGFGGLALAGLLSEASAATGSHANPLAPRPGHLPARAKRIIFLFMKGGPSQLDTFDYKPLLQRDHGKPLPIEGPRLIKRATGQLLGSPWKFQQHGDSGITISELFPHIATCADDLCVVRSLYGTNPEHGGAMLKLHTGTDAFVWPSMGSWIVYGLGTENQNLPSFITISPSLFAGGSANWSSAFLPAAYQGTPIGRAGLPADQAQFDFIENPATPPRLQVRQLEFLQRLNRRYGEQAGTSSELEARIESFELAFRMQTAVPELQNIGQETDETRRLYGLDEPMTRDFAHQCLLARRFAERGVRFIQLTHQHGPGHWDQHDSLAERHAENARRVDKPIAGLLIDLKRRGLLEDTLVLWGGEFGRTPISEVTKPDKLGREHNPHGFTMWLAGGGVKRGLQYGRTDDYGYFAVEDKVHIHDLHATILHLLGLDHTRLTYRYSGRDFRLTDVYGQVVDGMIA